MARFSIFLVSAAVLSAVLGTFVHEVFGHAFVGTLTGDHVTDVVVRAFGGHVNVDATDATIAAALCGVALALLRRQRTNERAPPALSRRMVARYAIATVIAVGIVTPLGHAIGELLRG